MKDNVTDVVVVTTWFSIPTILAFIDAHAASISILVGLPLMLIRIAIAMLDFRKKWRDR